MAFLCVENTHRCRVRTAMAVDLCLPSCLGQGLLVVYCYIFQARWPPNFQEFCCLWILLSHTRNNGMADLGYYVCLYMDSGDPNSASHALYPLRYLPRPFYRLRNGLFVYLFCHAFSSWQPLEPLSFLSLMKSWEETVVERAVWMHRMDIQGHQLAWFDDLSGPNPKASEVLYTIPQGSGQWEGRFYCQALALHWNLKPQRGKCTCCLQNTTRQQGRERRSRGMGRKSGH